MKISRIFPALAVTGVAFLSATPAMAATAAPQAASASAATAPAVAGYQHTEVVSVSRAENRNGSVSPDYSLEAVSPRVSCGGFNGNVEWSGPTVEIWGEVWDTCGGDTYVYLSWNNPTHHNQAVGTAQPYSTNGVPVQSFGGGLNVSNIAVTACSTYGGWHCGTPVHV
jgi:hypothetical protein